jgi:hypothetical protein
MKTRRATTYTLLLLLVLMAGCDRGTGEPTSVSVPTLGEPQFTSTPVEPALEPSATPSSVPPTATALSTVPGAEADATRIQFEPGATSATVTGHVRQLGVVRYVLRAVEGQSMDVVITSPRSDVLLNVIGADGTPLKRYVDGRSRWQGILPATQDYYLDAVSIGAATDFTLKVTIPPLVSTPEPEPERISFASGATTATVTDHVVAYGAGLYVLRALGGQTMDVVLSSPAPDVLLEIWGADGTVLKRHVDGEVTWSGVLPSTQDYFLKVVSFGSDVDYALVVTIPPLASTPAARPERISFASGATTATVTGHVLAYGADLYVLRAMEGQTMDVVLSSPAFDVLLEIWGADGTVLKRHVDGEVTWSGVLPATQDYFLKVVSFGSEVDYSLSVTIPPLVPVSEPERISFASGATTATVSGHVVAYGADLYVLRAMGGQTMDVVLSSPAPDVLLEIWGADGTVLKRHVDGETIWSGALPTTQDYFLKVVSFGSEVDYSLTVTIPPA